MCWMDRLQLLPAAEGRRGPPPPTLRDDHQTTASETFTTRTVHDMGCSTTLTRRWFHAGQLAWQVCRVPVLVLKASLGELSSILRGAVCPP